MAFEGGAEFGAEGFDAAPGDGERRTPDRLARVELRDLVREGRRGPDDDQVCPTLVGPRLFLAGRARGAIDSAYVDPGRPEQRLEFAVERAGAANHEEVAGAARGHRRREEEGSAAVVRALAHLAAPCLADTKPEPAGRGDPVAVGRAAAEDTLAEQLAGAVELGLVHGLLAGVREAPVFQDAAGSGLRPLVFEAFLPEKCCDRYRCQLGPIVDARRAWRKVRGV